MKTMQPRITSACMLIVFNPDRWTQEHADGHKVERTSAERSSVGLLTRTPNYI